MRPFLINAALTLTTAMSAPALAQQAVELIGDDLSRTRARLHSVSADRVVWTDPSGQQHETPIDEVLGFEASAPRGGEPAASLLGVFSYEPSMLRLVDGRRLTGAPSIEPGVPESLRWQHPVLGEVDVPLEQIDRISLHRTTLGGGPPELLPPADAADVLLMRNGDRLEGFVVELGPIAVIEVDGREITAPMEAVHQIAMANPPSRWTGPMLWLRDGSALGVATITMAGAEYTITHAASPATEAETGDEPGLPAVTIRAEHVGAVSFDTASLVPLSQLVDAHATTDSAGAFGAEPIVLRGGAARSVELPPRARRMTLIAELPLRARAWGRCELVLSVDGVVRARLPLSAATPSIEHTLELDGARQLGLSLENGEFGRVQSVAEIRRALIAVD